MTVHVLDILGEIEMFLTRVNPTKPFTKSMCISLLCSTHHAHIHCISVQRAPIQKKPASAYMRYVKSVYHETAQLEMNTKQSQVITLIAEKWREMSDEEKSNYSRAFREEQEEWNRNYENATEEEIRAYEEEKSLKKEKKEKRAVRKKKLEDKDPRDAYRNINAYSIFNHEIYSSLRQKFPDYKQQELVKKIGNEWHQLSKENKDRFQDIAAAIRGKARDSVQACSFMELYKSCYIPRPDERI